MENLTHAIYMSFAVFVFIVAFSCAMYMVSQVNETATTLVYRLDKSNYYDSLVLDDLIASNDEVDNKTSKIVGIDAIIPTLYRYHKESFAVKILDENGNLLQLFDLATESLVWSASRTITSNRSDTQKALLSLYGASNPSDPLYKCNMFGAPWMGDRNKDAKQRIDMYISGGSGYIDSTWVTYESNYLNMYKDKKFKETFVQYAYEGDTITESTYDGENVTDELISLTGTHQISTKIVITYQLLP